MSAMGRFRGGAAKIAVVGSALFGMISGSAVSNVLAVGIVTIPTMSRSGFTPYRAAAIEAVGSTGGQLMPPVMGAAAFIMAEFLQVPYGAVCIAATIPALLYYAACSSTSIWKPPSTRSAPPRSTTRRSFSEVLKSGWHFLVPIVFLIVALIVPGVLARSPDRAAADLSPPRILIVLSDDLRLPRQARQPSSRCCKRHASTPAAPRSTSS